MNLRKWIATAIVAGAGVVAVAAEPAAKVADPSLVSFGTLKTMPAAEAKGKVEGWLKAQNKLDQAKVDAIWASDKTELQKTVECIALGNPAAKAALDDARDITKDAPTTVPAVIKDEKDAFVKGNLAAAYARALAGKKVYEEALLSVKDVKAEEVVDPSAFLFFKAVAEHSVAGYEKARKIDAVAATLVRLLDDVTDSPDRYKMVATLMFFDIQNWSKDDKDLGNIGKLMDSSGRRLDLARGGQTTQTIQKRIIFRLDEKIKELEEKAKGGGGGGNGGSCPDGGTPGPAGGLNPSSPAGSSTLPNTGAANGKVDEKELKRIAEVWGTLPEAERVKIAQKMVADAPAKYKPYVEEYFKALQNSSK